MGLRGIAIILVLFFHLDLNFFSKGYYGVDIFFVLSGFFICKSIIEGLEKKKFSLKLFYGKRFLRIFPLLIIVIISTNLVGYFLLTDLHLKKLGESSLFSIIGLSNFYFLGDHTYFSEIKTTKPLLHLWSISIEIQFYVLAPILLFLFFKKKKLFFGFLPLILFLIFSSGYILSDGFYKVDSLKTYLGSGLNNFFYLTPFRIYGFLFGMFAFIFSKYNFYKKYATSSVIISSFLIASIIFLDLLQRNIYSLFDGLLVTFSIFIIIININHKFLRFLEFKILQFSGKVSYSIYLVHWPILIFFNYKSIYNDSQNTLITKFVLILIIYLISYVSYQFIEEKFRYSQQKKTKKNLIHKKVFYVLIIFSLGLSTLLINNKSINRGEKVYKLEPVREKISFHGNKYDDDIVLMGDSMIQQFFYYFKTLNFKTISFQRGGCPMLPSLQRVRDGKIDKICDMKIDEALNYIKKTKNKTIILSLYWDGYFTKLYKKKEHIISHNTKPNKISTEKEYRLMLLNSLKELAIISKKNNHKIIIIDHLYFKEMKSIIHNSQLPFNKKDISLITFERAKLRSEILKDILLSNNELKKNFIYFNPYLKLCELECKKIAINNIFLMNDNIHFSSRGIEFILELNNYSLKKLIIDLQN